MKLTDELCVTESFFDGVEVLALEIFDKRHLEDGAVVGLAHEDGNFGQARELGGAPAAFSGDQFEIISQGADDEWLNDALFLDGISEFTEGFG